MQSAQEAVLFAIYIIKAILKEDFSMKKHLSTIIMIGAFVLGLGLILYPSVSNYWNSLHQSRAISTYVEAVDSLDDDEYSNLLDAAKQYNSVISQRGDTRLIDAQTLADYNKLLNPSGNGIMAHIEIPSINVSLPVYHGVSDSVLQIAVGHLDWSALPVGGESTHCVLSGHRGLPSAKLFTNLDKLVEGDVFMLHVLKETFTYQVDQILIVEPQETESLNIIKGGDYCTLVTCTPYGINSHRLLVRGHRIDNIQEDDILAITAEATQIDPVLVAPVVAVPFLLLLFIYVMIKYRKRR